MFTHSSGLSGRLVDNKLQNKTHFTNDEEPNAPQANATFTQSSCFEYYPIQLRFGDYGQRVFVISIHSTMTERC